MTVKFKEKNVLFFKMQVCFRLLMFPMSWKNGNQICDYWLFVFRACYVWLFFRGFLIIPPKKVAHKIDPRFFWLDVMCVYIYIYTYIYIYVFPQQLHLQSSKNGDSFFLLCFLASAMFDIARGSVPKDLVQLLHPTCWLGCRKRCIM